MKKIQKIAETVQKLQISIPLYFWENMKYPLTTINLTWVTTEPKPGALTDSIIIHQQGIWAASHACWPGFASKAGKGLLTSLPGWL